MPTSSPDLSRPSLYDARFEHDACGVGFVARISGQPEHAVLQKALTALSNLTHRGALDADGKSGDGAGVLTQLPHRLLARELEAMGQRHPGSGRLGVGMVFLPGATDAAERCMREVERALTAERGGGHAGPPLPVGGNRGASGRARGDAGRSLRVLGWRTVPVEPGHLGETALATQPDIHQVLVACPDGMDQDAFERSLYLALAESEQRLWGQGLDEFYVASLSSRTVVYKGLMAAPQLARFYRDLADPEFETAIALFHQRYSTNTFPNWQLAQPFRMLAHNGEINTLQGNRNWMRARESELRSELWGDALERLKPIVWEKGSDSASLDNVLELLRRSGRDVLHGMMMLVPEAWENDEQLGKAETERREDPLHPSFRIPSPLTPEVRSFYQYHSCLVEPWDGPAAVAFTDGVTIGAALDRNGLRPCRYKITDDGLVIAASEVGVIDQHDGRIVEKGRLGPGQMIAVDTARQRVLKNRELKAEVAARQPYGAWLEQQVVRIRTEDWGLGTESAEPAQSPVPSPQSFPGNGNGHHPNGVDLLRTQWAFGYTAEDVRMIIRTMGAQGLDPVWSMGDDTPLAALSQVPRLLYGFFKQRFAQVTNPPIDPLRESLVMSLRTWVGPRRSLLEETPGHAHLLDLPTTILRERDMAGLTLLGDPGLAAATVPTLFESNRGPAGLTDGLDELCAAAERQVRAGTSILVLSDRGVDAGRAPIPMLLAVGAIHHHLIRAGLRMRADLVVETGEAWDVHHFATLIGYGAAAVYPWLALKTVREVAEAEGARARAATEGGRRNAGGGQETSSTPPTPVRTREEGPTDPDEAEENFVHAAEKGLLKIMSKMGISTLSSYRGAQIFEALGLAPEVVNRCFQGTPSRIGGLGFQEIAQDVLKRHQEAFGMTNGSGGGASTGSAPAGAVQPKLPDYGLARYRRDGEYHGWEPPVVRAMHQAALTGEYEHYKTFVELSRDHPPATLRDLIDFRRTRRALPPSAVEPVEAIRKRFISTAMSLGALSPEAHSTLAVAMNRIGARSNSGEGGEDPANYVPRPNGDVGHNKIKQVASARFGVTAEYLSMADELEIKMAQGSKPGEGGQLPAIKVNAVIARLRHAVPGISLISPPPHHDIYSIEDLAQLIYDLKRANPRARVGVKLVSEAGVGTIAAGVAKAYADYVLISGDSGGTGASPLSSIKNAGCPWELGLAETQQVLVLNGLRGRLSVRTDGGLKTGRDIVLAAMLGAEEFGFGTASVVAIGCDMARQCHLNTCPTGIATQREDLRARFPGRAEMAIHYFTHLAEEVREILADLGFRSLDEVVGRVDLLEALPQQPESRAALVDTSLLLAQVDPDGKLPHRRVQERNDRPDEVRSSRLEVRGSSPDSSSNVEPRIHVPLDLQITEEASEALAGRGRFKNTYPIRNIHRTVGATVAYEIARRYGSRGLPPRSVELRFRGSAGQSFGAFACNGMRLVLEGEANDYVGKGLCGGEVVLKLADTARFPSQKNVIMGNTVLYGATSGKLFAAGRAGERFAVRNSGATAVVEGVGDHGCEYMTGGTVVVLGPAGRNFGAGMTNGVAYVLDEPGLFPQRYNPELVLIQRLVVLEDLEQLYGLVREHFEATGSLWAQTIMDAWDYYRALFWKVSPHKPAAPAPSSSEILEKATTGATAPEPTAESRERK